MMARRTSTKSSAMMKKVFQEESEQSFEITIESDEEGNDAGRRLDGRIMPTGNLDTNFRSLTSKY